MFPTYTYSSDFLLTVRDMVMEKKMKRGFRIMDYVSVLSLMIFLVHGMSFGYKSWIARENSKLSFQDIALSHCGILYTEYGEFQDAYALNPECDENAEGEAAKLEWLDYTQEDWDTLSTVFKTDGTLVVYDELTTDIQEGRLLITVNPNNDPDVDEVALAKESIQYLMDQFWGSVTDIKFLFSQTYLTLDYILEYSVSPGVDIAAFAKHIDANPDLNKVVLVNPNVNFGNLVLEELDNNSWFSTQSFDNEEAEQRHLEYIGYDELVACLPEWEVIKVGVVDNGFDLEHPDLKETLYDSYDEADKDDDAHIPKIEKAWNHGTKERWLIWAKHNDVWVRGVVPNAELIVIKSTRDNANGRDITNGIEAIATAYERGAQVINMSWGGFTDVAMLERVTKKVASKWVILVAAAGNYDKSAPFYPAAYEWVIGVSAIDDQWNKASFSNYGPWVDVSAPWVNILTTDLDNTYNKYNGTSESSPIVAGAIALAMSHGFTWEDLQDNFSENTQEGLWKGSLDVSFLCEAVQEKEEKILASAELEHGTDDSDEAWGSSSSSSFIFPDIDLISLTNNRNIDYVLFFIVLIWVLHGVRAIAKQEIIWHSK